MQKVIITGASGLLGSNLISLAPEKYSVYGLYNTHKVSFQRDCSLLSIDLTNRNQVLDLLKINPDLIIHCAALTNVDQCEVNPNLAYDINVKGTENILEVSKKTGSFFIYISTDAVFDGKKGDYTEKDIVNPINVYGKTKVEAERMVENSDLEYCIVRTNIFGWNKLDKFSLAEWMLDKLKNNMELTAFFDVITSPILVNDLSDILFEIYSERITGILNVGAEKSCSKLDFAHMTADVFNFDKNMITPISVKDINFKAERGKKLGLNTKKAQVVLEKSLPSVISGLQKMKKLKDTGYVEQLKKP